MPTNSARKNAARALQVATGLSYADALRRISTDTAPRNSAIPNGCWIISTGDGNELELHFDTEPAAASWLTDWAANDPPSHNPATAYTVQQRLTPCLLLTCDECGHIEENDTGGPLHCLDASDLTDQLRWYSWYRYPEGRLHCPSCMAYPNIETGDRIRFAGQRQPFTVRATGAEGRYAVATRLAPGGRLQYTLLDFALGVRGTDNAYARHGYTTADQIAASLHALISGDITISDRNWVWLDYADDQPDATTAYELRFLRENAWRGYNAHVADRYNAAGRTPPPAPTVQPPEGLHGTSEVGEKG